MADRKKSEGKPASQAKRTPARPDQSVAPDESALKHPAPAGSSPVKRVTKAPAKKITPVKTPLAPPVTEMKPEAPKPASASPPIQPASAAPQKQAAKAAAKKTPAKTAAEKKAAAKAPAAKTPAAKARAAKSTASTAASRVPRAAATATPGDHDLTPAAEPLGPETQPFPSHPRGLAQPDVTSIEPELAASLQQAPVPVPEEVTPPPQDEVSRLVLMVRDPEWLFAYWTVVTRDREQHRIGQPHGAPPLLLRIYELDRPDTAPSEAYFDMTVIDDARGWYIHLPHSGGQWRATLGFLDHRGELYALCESNTVNVPGLGAGAAWPEEEAWGPAIETNDMTGFPPPEEQAGVMGALRGGAAAGAGEALAPVSAAPWLTTAAGASEAFQRRPGGASEQQPAPAPGALLGGASEQLGARALVAGQPAAAASMPPLGPAEAEAEKEQGFWLHVHTELIVYGATLPDAQVTVQDQPIRLRPDGTFTLRFALPDGEQIIPVRAVSADESEERRITPVVIRLTH